jgi:8-oxo-dGTP diphosphatase
MADPALVIEVVAAVIEHTGRILACRRRPGKSAAGKWEFPGGKIEPGETPPQALVREIEEELGIAIDVTRHLNTAETRVGEQTIRLICLRASLVGAAPTHSTDHDQLLWLLPAELSQLDWAEPDLPAVALLSAAL